MAAARGSASAIFRAAAESDSSASSLCAPASMMIFVAMAGVCTVLTCKCKAMIAGERNRPHALHGNSRPLTKRFRGGKYGSAPFEELRDRNGGGIRIACLLRLGVRTLGFHPGNRGSNPLGDNGLGTGSFPAHIFMANGVSGVMELRENDPRADEKALPTVFTGFPVHFVGIKGTGMTALAEVFAARGARITGSDTAEKFYTDSILSKLGIPFSEGFAAVNLPSDARLVIHSAAYSVSQNIELNEAVKRGLPVISYPQALGLLSARADSCGVSGVHGKSTTTALCGAILKAWNVPATVIVGTEVGAFGGRSTLVLGEKYLVAETCEYRRHFLNFHPALIVITSVEPDHLDYFRDGEDVLDAFEAYGRSVTRGGAVVFCADDPGASAVAARIRGERADLLMAPYGRNAQGDLRVTDIRAGRGETRFTLSGFPHSFRLIVPGEHNVLNAAAAIGVCASIWRKERDGMPDMDGAVNALSSFTGTRRRSEVVGEARGILVLDDYAHHPTAIDKTLRGFHEFYPGRRLVVDFMSHTYSRTKALLVEFGRAFSRADAVILHKIYASARESAPKGFSGEDLFHEVAAHHASVCYFEEVMEALPYLEKTLREGDIFVTMGAGDNWKLGREVLRALGGDP
jgi:UDP-N-acetylmuramate--alanine ligase